MFVFQLCDSQPDRDGYCIDLDTLKIAHVCPLLFDHSRDKIIGRVVKAWRDGGQILGQLEFANTPSGQCTEWSTQHGSLSHVSPLFLGEGATVEDGLTHVHHATIVEVTLTCLVGEPKSIRNVLLGHPAQPITKPKPSVWYAANHFLYDRDELQRWLEAQPVHAEGMAIDERAHTWTDPILQPA